MLIYAHGLFRSGDTHFSVPTFDFYFKIILPKANKERLIIERDKLGRIVRLKPAVINS